MPLLERVKSHFVDNEPDPWDPPSSQAKSVGEMLRRQRLELGIDLTAASSALKIKTNYLAAIEEGCPERLPGAAYALGFVRSYGDYLGLDGAELLQQVKLETAGFNSKPDLAFPMPLSERSLPSGWVLGIAIVCAVCGYGAWYHWSSGKRTAIERVAAVPPELLSARSSVSDKIDIKSVTFDHSTPGRNRTAADAEPRPNQRVLSAAGGVQTETSDSSPAGAGPVPTNTTPAATEQNPAPSPRVGTPTTAPAAHVNVPPTPTEAPAASQARNGVVEQEDQSRIMLRANAESWVQIRATDRSVLFTGILRPGDVYRVPNREGLTMRVGNAGGLDVIVDGKPTSALGPAGSVRNVSLDPGALTEQGARHD